MSQSKLKKPRKCNHCGHEIFGDAEKMREHEDDHKLADRAAKAGLVLPDMGIVLR